MARETRKEKLIRLSNEAIDLDCDLSYTEGKLYDIAGEIKKLKPTKKEIEDLDIQPILDCYTFQ